jgi:hypothetical protein
MKRPFGVRIPVKVLTRKAIRRVDYANRTANRHRYSGRVDQGVRVILRQGTRQYSDRNFGIRSAPSQCSSLCEMYYQFSFIRTNIYREVCNYLFCILLNLCLKTQFYLRVNVEILCIKSKEGWPLQEHISVVDNVTGPQLRSPSNCLPKTQVSANTKVDV